MSPLASQQMRSCAGAASATGNTIRMEAGWGFAAISTFFVPGDLDL